MIDVPESCLIVLDGEVQAVLLVHLVPLLQVFSLA